MKEGEGRGGKETLLGVFLKGKVLGPQMTRGDVEESKKTEYKQEQTKRLKL